MQESPHPAADSFHTEGEAELVTGYLQVEQPGVPARMSTRWLIEVHPVVQRARPSKRAAIPAWVLKLKLSISSVEAPVAIFSSARTAGPPRPVFRGMVFGRVPRSRMSRGRDTHGDGKPRRCSLSDGNEPGAIAARGLHVTSTGLRDGRRQAACHPEAVHVRGNGGQPIPLRALDALPPRREHPAHAPFAFAEVQRIGHAVARFRDQRMCRRCAGAFRGLSAGHCFRVRWPTGRARSARREMAGSPGRSHEFETRTTSKWIRERCDCVPRISGMPASASSAASAGRGRNAMSMYAPGSAGAAPPGRGRCAAWISARRQTVTAAGSGSASPRRPTPGCRRSDWEGTGGSRAGGGRETYVLSGYGGTRLPVQRAGPPRPCAAADMSLPSPP